MHRRRLSQRQVARIHTLQERRRQRLEARTQSALEEWEGSDREEPPRPGRVLVRHGARLVVEDPEGAWVPCLCRQHVGHPVCGDHVVWQASGPGQGVVTAIQPRASVLSRPDYSGQDKPLAANLTAIVAVFAPEPPPSPYLLDQYLVAAERMGIAALIVGHKADLPTPDDRQALRQDFAHYEAMGYPVLWTSLTDPGSIAGLTHRLTGQTSILVGQSGVGKSSLAQALLPDREIQIGRLSEATGLGRHTTSTATCYRLPTGGYLIDSPGVRSFRLGRLERAQLQQGFRDFRSYLGGCRFADCSHRDEPDCAIRAAVEAGRIAPQRLATFLHLAASLASQADRHLP